MQYVEHPLLREGKIERRIYQEVIAAKASEKNTLVVAPTALGKTIIAIMVMVHVLHRRGGKILFLSPTKPLVHQHRRSIIEKTKLSEEEVITLTGEIPPEKRREFYETSKVIVSTPQVIENDLIRGYLNLRDFSLIIFDEAHRAVGNYSYVYIAERYVREAENPLILGLTASPGGEKEKIEEVMRNLYIENLEVRTEKDPDVRPYVHRIEIEWRRVQLPRNFREIKALLTSILRDYLSVLKKKGYLETRDMRKVSRKEILELASKISGDPEALIAQANSVRLMHALELLETQGATPLRKYLERLKETSLGRGAQKSLRELVSDSRFSRVMEILKGINESHPKMKELKRILSKELFGDKRAIVFTQYRDTVKEIVNELSDEKGIKPIAFIGQANRSGERGMSQKEQVEILEKFRSGKYNVLVATSVAEEGLDIPSVDLVVFYEPIPSEIRSIQRRGRTGRFGKGKVVVLVAKGTRDETYYWVSVSKEEKMREELSKLKFGKAKEYGQQPDLLSFSSQPIGKIIVDNREIGSEVVKELERLGVGLDFSELGVGDYLLPDEICIERKRSDDFAKSIVDGRLFTQAKLLKRYRNPILLIEGEGYRGGLHPHSYLGALISLIVDFGIPVIFSRNEKETAIIIHMLLKRAMERGKKEISLRIKRPRMGTKEYQRFIVESLPGVGPSLADSLLRRFKTVERVMTASEEELIEVKNLGEKLAKRIREVLTKPYTEGNNY